MVNINSFYLGTDIYNNLYHDKYYYDINTGEFIDGSITDPKDQNYEFCVYTEKIDVKNAFYINFFIQDVSINDLFDSSAINILEFDKNNNFIKSKKISNSLYNIFYKKENNNIAYIVIQYNGYVIDSTLSKYRNKIILYTHKANPHFKSMNVVIKKETNQEFFRKSLDSKITLWQSDFDYVKNKSIDDNLYFCLIQNDTAIVESIFNKIDCKYDYTKKSVELKLTPFDNYTNILNKYETAYNLVKLSPKNNFVMLTKRAFIQIYLKGGNTVSNYANGVYWEDDVNEVIDDENELIKKYYFAKGYKYYEYNTGKSVTVENGGDWNFSTGEYVKFIKLYDAFRETPDIIKYDAAEGEIIEYSIKNNKAYSFYNQSVVDVRVNKSLLYSIYIIKAYINNKIYYSEALYADTIGLEKIFLTNQNSNAYALQTLDKSSKLYLGNNIIEQAVFARLICDKDSFDDKTIYKLPKDNFISESINYKNCIGIKIENDEINENNLIHIAISNTFSKDPTEYGMNDFGTYFTMPYSQNNRNYMPVCKNSWANTSIWVYFGNDIKGYEAFNDYIYDYNKSYIIKDATPLCEVISVLLKQINPIIKHDNNCSKFLYSDNEYASSKFLYGCKLFITQKTNILKGNYDQAAQKAEITLKSIFEMLRDCFKCYWYIDNENNLKIEHISYFENGLSYSNSDINKFNSLKYKDAFNKKGILYSQYELEYNDSDLYSQYKFKWMDDSTDSMANLILKFNNNYLSDKSDKDITISDFSTDIDYMLSNPDKFSNDGFALLAAGDPGFDIFGNEVFTVPIKKMTLINDKWNNFKYDTFVQNIGVSWNKLINHYTYDLIGDDISANIIDISNLGKEGFKKILKQTIKLKNNNIIDINNINPYLLVETEIGNGIVNNISINIDTNFLSLDLLYSN